MLAVWESRDFLLERFEPRRRNRQVDDALFDFRRPLSGALVLVEFRRHKINPAQPCPANVLIERNAAACLLNDHGMRLELGLKLNNPLLQLVELQPRPKYIEQVEALAAHCPSGTDRIVIGLARL